MFVFTFFITSLSFANNSACLPLINQKLKNLNYGTFDRPLAGVRKSTEPDGTVIFSSPGATKITISRDKILETSYMAGLNISLITTVDEACKITSVSGTTLGPTSLTASKADPKTCDQLRKKKSFNSGTNLNDQFSLAWCNEYFPKETSSTPSPHHLSPSTNPKTDVKTQN